MRTKRIYTLLTHLSLTAIAGLTMVVSSIPAHAAPWFDRNAFANPAFETVWTQSDRDVATGTIARSYTWGAEGWWDYKEYYRESPNGLRQVQYFDKARMEINDPGISGPRGVTNGLLTVEMVSGRVKMGDGTGPDDNLERQPAAVPVAGDPISGGNTAAPTYASFRGVATVDNGYTDPNRTGKRVDAVMDKGGNHTTNAALGADPQTEIVAYNTMTGHNVPRVFRDFLASGPVDAVFAFGYPITDPYWIKARVAGVEKDILVQLYERRAVTYTPTNAAAFRVEMGNVGQHYFQWRYPHLGQPWQAGYDAVNLPIAFASKRTSSEWQTFTMNTDGSKVSQITFEQAETVPYSWRRAYVAGTSVRLMTDSKRVRGERALYSIDPNHPTDVHLHGGSGGIVSFNGAVSPDGTQIAAAAQCCASNLSAITILPFDNAPDVIVSPDTPLVENCRYESPTWLPDGSGLVFAGNCDGKFALYCGDLAYQYTPTVSNAGADVVNIRAITNTPTSDNYYPRISPDGKRVLFTSNRNGAGDLYVIDLDGTNELRLTTTASDDAAGSWDQDGSAIVFQSNRDGDYEIYRAGITDQGLTQPEQLTRNTVDDQWPVWYQ